MRKHPILPVTEAFQYRAIGVVRGTYTPDSEDHFTRGNLIDLDGESIQSVVLGRLLTLMHRHIDLSLPHLWVVYPRCRDADTLHLQIAGIWEPSTLDLSPSNKISPSDSNNPSQKFLDKLPEGDDYFSVRGELIYTKPENNELILKIRQKQKFTTKKVTPFKLKLMGKVSKDNLKHFISLDVRRKGQRLCVEDSKTIGPIPNRGIKQKSRLQSMKRKQP